jgi:hypothetical protein
MKLIETEFVLDKQKDQHTTGEANGEPCYINKGENTGPFEVSPGNFQVMSEHLAAFLSGRRLTWLQYYDLDAGVLKFCVLVR